MQRGKTEVATLYLNGWDVNNILEGEEKGKKAWILITAIGEEKFFCRWDHTCTGAFTEETGFTTLTSREWTLVGGRIGNKLAMLPR